MTTKIPANVARGAAFLDVQMPGWDEKIDLRNLDVGSKCGCVLGQLHRTKPHDYAAYDRGLSLLHLTPRDAGRLGFNTWASQTFSRLTDGWKALVRQRRAEASYQDQERS